MKYGQRKYGGATCEIRSCEGIPDKIKHDVRMLCNLETEPKMRGQGHATELLNRVHAEADRLKVIMVLNPSPYGSDDCGGLALSELVEWYGQMGYQEIQHEPLLMARMFNIPQIVDSAAKISQLIIESAK